MAEDFARVAPEYFERGILMGLQTLFKFPNFNKIRSFEFPFTEYKEKTGLDKSPTEMIRKTCAKNGVECRFTKNDALEPTHPYLMTVTTNCGNLSAPMGNAMEHSSVDGAIAENVASKCNKFNPILNTKMKQRFMK